MLFAALFTSIFSGCRGQNQSLKIGDMAPVFSLRDQNDSVCNIADYLGKKILVIFFIRKTKVVFARKKHVLSGTIIVSSLKRVLW